MAKFKYYIVIDDDGQGWVSSFSSNSRNAKQHYKNNVPSGNYEAWVRVYSWKTGELIAMATKDIERNKIVNVEVIK